MTFSILLRKAMGSMSMSELSRRSGLPVSTISRHLHDVHEPTLGALEAYESVFPKIRQQPARKRLQPRA